MEGTIDLAAAFGSIPETIYVAAAAYQTADGGILASQGPGGNADGDIDPSEFMPLSISAIRDDNADGKYDRLDPAIGFVIAQISRENGITTIQWNSVPGKTYQLESCDQLGAPWVPLGNPRTAGLGELTLSTQDSGSAPPRFYRVVLVNP